MKQFGQRLQELRTERNMTQEDFGKLLNVSQSTIAYYESGKKQPSLETISFIADYFTVTIDYLLGRVDYRNSHNTIPTSPNDDPDSKLPAEAKKSIDDFIQYIYEKYGIKPE